MKVAFLTEMGFEGKIPSNHPNMRTEIAWMYALDADHKFIRLYKDVKDYDHVFVIFPKGGVYLNSIGVTLRQDQNPISDLLQSDIIQDLKTRNKKVYFVQEGPHWLWNDYEIAEQIEYYNMIHSCDAIFCHNKYDENYYLGMFTNKKVYTIPSLMIEDSIKDHEYIKEDKVIIGGNFARWYGGFESYTVASVFDLPIWAQSSHAKRSQEPMMENLYHLPRLLWLQWMKALSSFKYAIHLMPTIAAGTFSMNCAYFGIPCIGNEKVDTQRMCHPMLSVDVADIKKSVSLAKLLKNDKDFYADCSTVSRTNYKHHYPIKRFKDYMAKILTNE